MKREKLVTLTPWICLVLMLATLSLTGVSAKAAPKPLLSVVTIAAGTAGTVTNIIATALSKVAMDNTPIIVKVKAYSGPTAYAQLVETGEENFGFINIGDAWMAYRGIEIYKKAMPNLRVVAGGVHPFLIGLVVRKDSPIKELKDLRGKRVPTEYGGQANMQRQILAALETGGLRLNDVVSVPMTSYGDAAKAFIEGRIDVCPQSLGSGNEKEADAAVGIRYINYASGPEAEKIVRKYIPFVTIKAPKGVSSACAEGTILWGYPQHLMGSTKLDEATVQALLQSWWDNVNQLQAINPVMKGWTKETMALNLFEVPYCTASVKFFKDKGVWTKELEMKQQALLAK